jgi:hypothetical protein
MVERYVSPWNRRWTEATQTTTASAAVFMAFVAGGCMYIIAAKLEGIGQLYVTFVPVGIMIAYALLIYLARSLRLRDDQSGDNLYYMGFLFTLTSLGVALYQFSAVRAVEEIVQNFGIAIGTTIAGIGLRVVFNQMRRDPVEVERMMRLELAEAARRVRRELDSTAVEFGHHRRSVQQASADSFRHMMERFDEVLDKFFARLEEINVALSAPLEAASRRSADVIRDASQAIGAEIAQSNTRLANASKALSERTEAIAAALDEVTAKLGAMQTPERVIELRLESTAKPLTEAADRLAAQAEGQTTTVTQALERANAATARSLELIAALRQEFDAAASGNRANLEAATDIIKAMTEVLDEFKTSSKSYVEVLGFMLDKTDATMRTFTDVLIKSGVEAATQSEGLREALEASIQSFTATGERISAAVEDLRLRRRTPTRETID